MMGSGYAHQDAFMGAFHTDAPPKEKADAANKDMNDTMDWWAKNRDYKPPSDPAFDPDVKQAMKLDDARNRINNDKDLPPETTGKDLKDALKWYQEDGPEFEADVNDFNKDYSNLSNLGQLLDRIGNATLGFPFVIERRRDLF